MTSSTNSKDFLGKIVNVIIDRPLNSAHPKYGFKYTLNYGYIPNTVSGDGEEIDAYILGVSGALEKFKGKCIAVIQRLNDDDDKLVIVPKNIEDISDEEIKKQTFFQEQYFTSKIIRP